MYWKFLLFDLDGTLTDSREGILGCIRHAFETVGVEVPAQNTLLAFLGPPLMDSFQNIAGLPYDTAVQAVRAYRERYSVTGLFENRVYDGIKEALNSLKKQGYVIALATSKPEIYAVRILEHFGLLEYFDETVGSTMDEERNKKSDVIREVFFRLGLSEEEKKSAIMIGDRKHDIIGAKECGIASMGVYYGFAPQGELEQYGADYIVYNVEDMASFFLSQD